ncbi:surfeit locus protein 1 [Selaginella moellendorffii]|uniref:surfeit locus protein 1 n=1 Tax=Selaginella moellendorffii TaxID=88036 RepID=UPI000D1C50C6|nr:surfeit locus protein 1 [Selaginella moellendorffii]|eukprot:XP_002993388.2 surfeit locus protein 1 [Selaginella moellendorffii]
MMRKALQRYGAALGAGALRGIRGSAGAALEHELEPAATKKKLGLSVVFLFLPCVATFGLGTWQVKRRDWKAELLDYKRKRLEQDPVPLALAMVDDTSSSSNGESALEYRRVVCDGVYDEEKSIFIGPRMKQLFGSSQRGYYLVTPLLPASSSDMQPAVLVNRGWVPAAWREDFEKGVVTPTLDERFHQDKIKTGTWWRTWWKGKPTMEISPAKGAVTVCGVVRKSENPSMFVPLNVPEQGQWFYFDVPAMLKAAGLPENSPYIEAVGSSPGTDDKITFPVPKEIEDFVRTSLMPNDHLTYAFTWYTLSAATTYMAFKRIREKPVKPLKNFR